MVSFLTQVIGSVAAWGIRAWVRLTGKSIAKEEAAWLDSPMGPPGRIGSEFYDYLASRENLTLQYAPDAGLLPCFAALQSSDFDPDKVRREIHDFYEHTCDDSYRIARCGKRRLTDLASRPIHKTRRLIASPRSHYCVPSGHLDSQRVAIAVDLAVVGIEAQTVLVAKLLGD